MLPKLLLLYIEALKIHIGTKTTDKVFHEFSGDVYEKLFDTFHLIAEKLEDLDKGTYYNGSQEVKNRLYNIIEEAKTIIDGEKSKYSTGMDDLIRSLVNELETLCGTARGFTEEEYEEESEKKEDVVKKKLI